MAKAVREFEEFGAYIRKNEEFILDFGERRLNSEM